AVSFNSEPIVRPARSNSRAGVWLGTSEGFGAQLTSPAQTRISQQRPPRVVVIRGLLRSPVEGPTAWSMYPRRDLPGTCDNAGCRGKCDRHRDDSHSTLPDTAVVDCDRG